MALSATVSIKAARGVAGGKPGKIIGRFVFSGAYAGGALTVPMFKQAWLRFHHIKEIILGFAQNGYRAQVMDSIPITGSTNATPIVITTTDADHGLQTGMEVTIAGITGNTNANGTFTITRVDANEFSLDGSVGNGVHGGSGVCTPTKNKDWLGFLRLYSSGTTEASSTVATELPFGIDVMPM